eukprot:2231822-Amphidinium_carterae.3
MRDPPKNKNSQGSLPECGIHVMRTNPSSCHWLNLLAEAAGALRCARSQPPAVAIPAATVLVPPVVLVQWCRP